MRLLVKNSKCESIFYIYCFLHPSRRLMLNFFLYVCHSSAFKNGLKSVPYSLLTVWWRTRIICMKKSVRKNGTTISRERQIVLFCAVLRIRDVDPRSQFFPGSLSFQKWVLRIRIWDQVLFWPRPWIWIRNKFYPDHESPTHLSESLVTIDNWLKYFSVIVQK